MRAVLAAIACWAGAFAADAAAQQQPVRFNRDIRPILTDNCFSCHGPDSARRKAGLRLDTEEGLYGPRDNGAAVNKGDPAGSALIERVFDSDPGHMMPPPKANRKLTQAQKDLLKRWVKEGAPFEQHWSFVKPARPAIPTVKNQAWVKNPIDAFILEKLEALKLTPAPEADRRSLIRRVTLDLTGLLPTPEQVEAFVADKSPDAYGKLVDRLLASEQYGEHRARYWLDAARYGDTHGLHFDNYREMWPYRDWVINAFNKNLPFDRFTIEQLAGDLLPNRTPEQLIASGFHRCNITTNEGGSIAEEVLVGYARDRVTTTGTVWLGLTVNCCECHNHKFDPLTQKEFYQLAAFFRNTTQGAMDGNIPDTPPIMVVPSMTDRPRWDELQKLAADLKARREKRKNDGRGAFDKWLKADEAAKLTGPLDPSHEKFILSETKTPSKTATTQPGPAAGSEAIGFTGKGGLDFAKAGALDAEHPFSLSLWFYVPTAEGNYTIASKSGVGPKDKGHGWRIELKNRIASFTMQGNDPKSDAITRTLIQNRLEGGKWAHLTITYEGKRDTSGLALYLNGKIALSRSVAKANFKGSLANDAPLRVGPDFNGGRVADVRFFDRAVNAEEANVLAGWLDVRGEIGKKLSPASQQALALLYFNRFDTDYRSAVADAERADNEIKAIRTRSAVTHVMAEQPGVMATAKVLYRGQYDQPREQVNADVFAVLPPLAKGAPHNRLGLAQWIVSPDNPLTARVTVNRFWQEIFGVGLVRTSEDLGSSGEAPSHQRLLDWLAVEFREKGWDTKQFFKLIVTSNTYKQAAITTPEKRERDPQNRYLSRGPRYRMDAEMVRDTALGASGLLVQKIGGPSVKPYQPEGVWESVGILGASNTREYKHDKGDGLYRRSLYWFWKRMAAPASLEIFNAPSRETCTVRRERTNTPIQALVTMNDPQYVEAARHLAELSLKADGDAARFEVMGMRLLARPFRAEEKKVLSDSLREFATYYREHPKEADKLLAVGDSPRPGGMEAPTLAAWTMLANEVMNLDEALNK
jgi:hypothetical protein